MLRSEYCCSVPALAFGVAVVETWTLCARMLMCRNSAMEYERHTDSYFDPFAEMYNVSAPASAFGNGV